MATITPDFIVTEFTEFLYDWLHLLPFSIFGLLPMRVLTRDNNDASPPILTNSRIVSACPFFTPL